MSPGEPPDVELLADLDAGVLDADRARAVRARAAADPASARVLEALAATRADLGALPPLAVPTDVLAEWINRTTESPPDVSYITLTLSGDNRRFRPALAAAAAALVAVVVGSQFAGAATDPARVDSVGTVELAAAGAAAAGAAASGTFDVGPLADPARLAGCLRAAGVRDALPLGGRPVLLEDRPGILLVFPAGAPGRLRIVVVDPACGPDGAIVLADTTVGR
ncbi:hypothetical protein [Pseudonocardia sp.]|uniref:hypothetical protein n=1 Tax=Pseudonocardia sp. TaxID=60912 RepID=UPI003D0DEFEE